MTNQPDHMRMPRLRVKLSVVRGHYANANHPDSAVHHIDAMNAAMRDIPALVMEIERLWAIACLAHQRYANLRAAALACVAAYETDEPDPLFYLRDELMTHQPSRTSSRRRG
jgi:hypothetical protein